MAWRVASIGLVQRMDFWMDVWTAPLGFCRIVEPSVSRKRVSFTEKLTVCVCLWRLELGSVSKRQSFGGFLCVIDRQKRFHLLGVDVRIASVEMPGQSKKTFQRIRTVGRFSMVASIAFKYFLTHSTTVEVRYPLEIVQHPQLTGRYPFRLDSTLHSDRPTARKRWFSTASLCCTHARA
jgi:hypothetical protein